MATAHSTFTHIVLTADQLRVMREAHGSVELRDETGTPVGLASPLALPHGWTEEDIRLAKAASNSGSPRYTTAQVLDALRSQAR